MDHRRVAWLNPIQKEPASRLARFQIRTERFTGRQLGFLTLGGVERKRNTRLEPTPPPSGSSNKRPQLPGWGRFFLVTTFDAVRGPTSRMVTSVGKQAPKTKTAPDEVSSRIINSVAKADQSPEPAAQPHLRGGKASRRTGHQQSAQPAHDTTLCPLEAGSAFRASLLFPWEPTRGEKPRPMGIKGQGQSRVAASGKAAWGKSYQEANRPLSVGDLFDALSSAGEAPRRSDRTLVFS